MEMDFDAFKIKYQKKEVEEYPNQVNDTPLVSVCVQTYQHAPYIQKCLDGILMQKTDFAYEILLGEDNSSDGTREICIKYAKRHPDKIRFFLHHRENNIAIDDVPSGRFNFMYNLYNAKGRYIAICEGDDYWTDSFKLQKQVDFLENNREYMLTFHDAQIMDEEGKIVTESKLGAARRCDRTQENMAVGVLIPTLTVLFRNVINQYPKEIYKVMNCDTFLFALHGKYGEGKFLSCVKPAVYRKHAGGVWSLKGRSVRVNSAINTNKLLLRVIDRKFSHLIRNKVLRLMLEATYYKKGLYGKVGQYLSSYKYFRLNKQSIKISLVGNYKLIKRTCFINQNKTL